MRVRDRFTGAIAGAGSTSGTRIVVGRWDSSPWGPFADVMIEDASGHRVLLAPDERTRDFVIATYVFDEVVLEPVQVTGSAEWHVVTPSLDLTLHVGGRTALGALLRGVPPFLATSPVWCAAVDPVARVALRGVRTRGTAGSGRREWYGATSVHAITALGGTWRGAPLGTLARVDPPCRFGFSSTPARPSVTSLVTTVERES
ncbi:hypothetical protein [Nocardioides sp.]|uniref:hypothetical protein n=1 Tax=Nocardioides sp. TaxID=35761 RepID=UPI00262D59B9|nr:hypothetical protein [Nocardioides sp.]